MQSHPIVLFDGECNFCNGVVNFIIRRDKEGVFRFAAMQSAEGQALLRKHGFPPHYLKSFVLIDQGKVFKKSTAGLKLYGRLPGWKWTRVFWIVPKFFRDAIYQFISNNRYRWFGRKDQCMIPTSDIRSRFL